MGEMGKEKRDVESCKDYAKRVWNSLSLSSFTDTTLSLSLSLDSLTRKTTGRGKLDGKDNLVASFHVVGR